MATKTVDVKIPVQLKDISLRSRDERIAITNDLLLNKPDLGLQITPTWWPFARCEVNVLIVTDGGLDFGLSGFGLSEFITSFAKLEQESLTNIRYKVTLAHRKSLVALQNQGLDPMLLSNTSIHNRINSFNFDTSVNLNSFDQVWIFGIQSSFQSLSPAELAKVTAYMNGGGGLFATGDHGTLGAALCNQIPRVKDMRYWTNTDADNNLNEVSMTGMRRNDTNQPQPGSPVSTLFQNQSDNIPQTIAARTFGGGMPHPLLSISTSKRPSGVIDIMPDHPHEGECKHEATFTVTHPTTGVAYSISSQIIATSFVRGGNTSGGKAPTVPHCFPSIAVWDGRPAAHGRIVVDSTWHHFVNINLNGSGQGVGLDAPDFDVIQQYYMNIAKWISRRKKMLCIRKFILVDMFKATQVIESSMDKPDTPLEKISLHDLHSIGMLTKEIIGGDITPAFAEEFVLDIIEEINPELANHLDPWKPQIKEQKSYQYNLSGQLIDFDWIVSVAIGSGFIALRDRFSKDEAINEKTFEQISDIFIKGAQIGLEKSLTAFQKDLEFLAKSFGPSSKATLKVKPTIRKPRKK